ncbi:MAG: redoxin domain-containing protein [Candidatus Marinimicrobia bacterium]|nr:redoxin domain-containing protein [Candidatus Neomarinimicrobiota bacterium]
MSVLGIIVLVIVSILIGFFINSIFFYAQQDLKEGKPAPSFYCQNLDGEKWGRKAWSRPPRPIFLVYISPSCVVCRRLVRFIDELSKEYPDANLDILVMGINGSIKTFAELKEKLNVDLKFAVDIDGVSKMHYAIYSLPMVFLISSGGLIKKKYRGFRAGDDVVYRKLFKKKSKKAV